MNRSTRSLRRVAGLLLACAAGCQNVPAETTPPASGEPAANAAASPAPGPQHPAAPRAAAPSPVHLRAAGQLGPGNNTLYIELAPPAGAKLTADSPVSVRASGGIGLSFPSRLSGPLGSHSMPLRLPIEVADGATGPAQVELSYYWCTDGNDAACQREQAQVSVELDLTGASAGGEALLSYRARGDRS